MKTIQLVIERVENAHLVHEIIFEGVAQDGTPVTRSVTTAHVTKDGLVKTVEALLPRMVSKSSLGDE